MKTITRLLVPEDLKYIQKKPTDSELSLQVILEFYQEYLMDRLFVFELDYPTQPIIKLKFEKDNLCHLLGFQHIFEGEPNASDYGGFLGFQKILSGEVTISTFKEEPRIKAKYTEQRERILYFSFVYQLVKNPTVILFSNEHLHTKITSEFIFYDKRNNRYLHLGVDKHTGTDYYFPRTFFVRKKNDLLLNQTHINVLQMTETI